MKELRNSNNVLVRDFNEFIVEKEIGHFILKLLRKRVPGAWFPRALLNILILKRAAKKKKLNCFIYYSVRPADAL